MDTLVKTQRSYTEFYTGKNYAMFQNSDSHANILVNEQSGDKIRSFICAAFNSITYQFSDKSEITLSVGQFLEWDKMNPPKAKKFTGIQKRFSKL
jgi:hypothetical protein